MAVINYTQKWIYLMEPHTASHAVAESLTTQLQGSQVGHHHASLMELTDSRRSHISKRAKDFDVLCTVRNPFDVLVIRWLLSSPKSLDYESVCDVAHSMNLTTQEIEETDLPHTLAFSEWAMSHIDDDATRPLSGLWEECNKVVHYERLEDDLGVLFGCDVVLPTDPKHVTKTKLDYQKYYQDQDDLVTALTLRYQGYLSKYGYNVDYSDGYLEVYLEESIC